MNSFSRHSGVFARNSATSTRTKSINTPESPGGLGFASPSYLATTHLYDNEKLRPAPSRCRDSELEGRNRWQVEL